MDGQKINNELRNFGFIMAGMIALIFGIIMPFLFSHNIYFWPWIVSSLFLITAIISPAILKPVYALWMKFSHIMNWINTRLIISIMYYFIITPISLLMKLFGHDPMSRKITNEKISYRIINYHSKEKSIDDLKRPF